MRSRRSVTMLEYLFAPVGNSDACSYHPRLQEQRGAACIVLDSQELTYTYRGRIRYHVRLPVHCIAIHKKYTFNNARMLGSDRKVYEVVFDKYGSETFTVLGPWPSDLNSYVIRVRSTPPFQNPRPDGTRILVFYTSKGKRLRVIVKQ